MSDLGTTDLAADFADISGGVGAVSVVFGTGANAQTVACVVGDIPDEESLEDDGVALEGAVMADALQSAFTRTPQPGERAAYAGVARRVVRVVAPPGDVVYHIELGPVIR
jgi:hypothetical protein